MYQDPGAEFLAVWSKYSGGLRQFPDKSSHFGLLYGRVYGFFAHQILGRTHVRLKGQNLNLHLETHSTSKTMPSMRLRKLAKTQNIILTCGWYLRLCSHVHTSTQIWAKHLNFFPKTQSTSNNISLIQLWNLVRNPVHYTGVWLARKNKFSSQARYSGPLALWIYWIGFLVSNI